MSFEVQEFTITLSGTYSFSEGEITVDQQKKKMLTRPVEFDDIHACISAIDQKFNCLTHMYSAFFTFVDKDNYKKCFHTIRGLPEIHMVPHFVKEDINITISNEWDGIRYLRDKVNNERKGWDSVPGKDSYSFHGYMALRSTVKTYKARGFFSLNKIRSITVNQWGLTIRTDSGIGMSLVNNMFLEDFDSWDKNQNGYFRIPWKDDHKYKELEQPIFSWGAYDKEHENFFDGYLENISTGKDADISPKKCQTFTKNMNLDLL